MLEQPARVIESSEAGVWVEPVAPSGCGVCAGQGCASHQLAGFFQRRPRRYWVQSSLQLSVGEHVVVGLPDGRLLSSVFLFYGLPLVFILAGAVIAHQWHPGDAAAVSGALAGGCMAWGLTFITRTGRRVRSCPEILRCEQWIAIPGKGN